MIRVLGRKTSGNVQKVLFFLEETGTEYERKDYGRQFENTGTAEYLKMNPTGKVPTVIDGDTVIWESNTILRYLAARYAPGLTGANPAECTEVERWMDFLLASINSGYLAAFKGSRLEPADRPDTLAGELDALHGQMAIVNDALEGKQYLALGKLTIADIALGPILGRCLNFPYDRPSMPALEAWFEQLSGRESFKKATK